MDKNKQKDYSDEIIIATVAAVRNGPCFGKAAENNNVPVTTVRDRHHGK